jgi:hypothetical protein
MDPQTMNGLYDLSLRHTVADLCGRLEVRAGKNVVLDGQSISERACRLSAEVPEEKVRKFCKSVKASYRLVETAE